MRKITLVLTLVFGLALNAQVGINTDTPLSTLDINGNLSVKHISLTGAGTPTLIDDGVYISISTTAAGQRFQLPDATLVPGRVYILRNVTNVHDAIIETAGAGVEFFAGNNSTSGTATVTLQGTNTSTKTLIFISDGSNWTYGMLGF